MAWASLAFIDGLGAPEMGLIFVLVLVLFGGQKLPEFARGLGKSIREFKKAAAGVEEEFKRALEEDERKHTVAQLPAPAATAAAGTTAGETGGPDAASSYNPDEYHDYNYHPDETYGGEAAAATPAGDSTATHPETAATAGPEAPAQTATAANVTPAATPDLPAPTAGVQEELFKTMGANPEVPAATPSVAAAEPGPSPAAPAPTAPANNPPPANT